MSEIFVNDPEAFSEEYEEFNQAIANMDSDPVEMLRAWYVSKGEIIEGARAFYPDSMTCAEIEHVLKI